MKERALWIPVDLKTWKRLREQQVIDSEGRIDFDKLLARPTQPDEEGGRDG